MAPAKKYCDMTGLEAPYTCPRTLMRYSDKATYQAIQDLPEGGEQGFLAMRNAAVKLK